MQTLGWINYANVGVDGGWHKARSGKKDSTDPSLLHAHTPETKRKEDRRQKKTNDCVLGVVELGVALLEERDDVLGAHHQRLLIHIPTDRMNNNQARVTFPATNTHSHPKKRGRRQCRAITKHRWDKRENARFHSCRGREEREERKPKRLPLDSSGSTKTTRVDRYRTEAGEKRQLPRRPRSINHTEFWRLGAGCLVSGAPSEVVIAEDDARDAVDATEAPDETGPSSGEAPSCCCC